LHYTTAATNLLPGNYTTSLKFNDLTYGAVLTTSFQFQVRQPLSVQPTNTVVFSGPVSGAFYPTSQDASIVNLGTTSAVWRVSKSATWLAVNVITGAVGALDVTNFTMSITTNANKLKAGIYKATVTVQNHPKTAGRFAGRSKYHEQRWV